MMLAVAQVKKEDLATKNTKSPGAETSVTVNGKNLWIYYHAPSVRGRPRKRIGDATRKRWAAVRKAKQAAQ